MLNKTPAQVVRMHDKDKSTVEIKYPDHTENVSNMLPKLKIGDYVIVNDGIIIEVISEKEAVKRMR